MADFNEHSFIHVRPSGDDRFVVCRQKAGWETGVDYFHLTFGWSFLPSYFEAITDELIEDAKSRFGFFQNIEVLWINETVKSSFERFCK